MIGGVLGHGFDSGIITTSACYWLSGTAPGGVQTHQSFPQDPTTPFLSAASFPNVSTDHVAWKTGTGGANGWWKPGTTGGGGLPQLHWENPPADAN